MLIDLSFSEIQTIIDILGNNAIENWKFEGFHPYKAKIIDLNQLVSKLENYNFQHLVYLASLSENAEET